MIEEFYSNVPAVTDFSGIADPDLYIPLPDEWSVITADVRNSTHAIRIGKYKEVNMAGASIITAISNYFKPAIVPFIFGGDGSTIAIPTRNIRQINGILLDCQEVVQTAYGLDLAAGCISMKKIREAGYDIKIARYRLSDIVEQAIFWGNGLEYAEELIKSDTWSIEDHENMTADFSGLECRWREIPSQKDEVLAMIIKVIAEDEDAKHRLYRQCIDTIENIYGNDVNYRPLQIDQLKLTGNPALLSVELKMRSRPATFINKLRYGTKIIYLQIAGWMLMKFGIKTKKTNWNQYKTDFIQHADYRKFSDGLRLVITGSVAQRMELQEYLDNLFEEKKLAYGMHSSFAAITTCYVTDYNGHHVHFVDGSDGGYSKASQDLKLRLSKLVSS